MQNDPNFQQLDVQMVSIAFDSLEEQSQAIVAYGIHDVPMLSDADGDVSEAYDVLQWAARTGEPGHTFILVDAGGTVVWIKDYGSPDLPDPVMWVDPGELVFEIEKALAS